MRHKIPFFKYFSRKEPFSALFVFFMTYFFIKLIISPMPLLRDTDLWLESVARLVAIIMGGLVFFLKDREDYPVEKKDDEWSRDS